MASDPTVPSEDDAPTSTFMTFLAALDGGQAHGELTEELQNLVQQCRALNKGGTLALKLNVKPTRSGPLEIAYEVVVKAPQPEPPTSFFFADSKGGLHRRDPRQLAMDGLREAPPAAVADAS